MQTLTPALLRASFVNTTRREAAQAIPPVDLESVDWDQLDLFGWVDRNNPQRAYLVLPWQERSVGVLLRAVPSPPRKNMCAFCEDITQVSDVRMLVAKLAGPAGRRGDTVGTLAHTAFGCSSHARRLPTRMEGQENPEAFIASRVERLRANVEHFAQRVLNEA